MDLSRTLLVTRLLVALGVACLLLPAQAQWGGGDGAQAGATAYCAAKAAGKDDREASRAASKALATSMTGSLSRDMAAIIVGGGAMWQSVQYLVGKQCPEYLRKSDLNPFGVDWMKEGATPYYKEPLEPNAAAHEKCLKAADYSGCMKFQLSK